MTELAWFKSSYSDSGGGQCVEIAWSKSSYSGSGGGQCVEVAACDAATAVHVRDSKRASGPMLTVAPGAWGSFVALVRG
ncbi:DUF397 domain-containing protein [Streptomyces sp. 8L]|uniref:DUF397 domain-containing protein n=1 Tax=Streptomyces sp. 8L TaxID=2877242 RepID=UPI001CD23D43|nr:DUF397 domain-containing protein [Streptomyces sp. 8L]MCA1222837.1 DUF397 domain-containing protein [Streptomyces sp. 8L]